MQGASLKKKNLIIYSPLCCSKPVWVSVFCETQKKKKKKDIMKNITTTFVHIMNKTPSPERKSYRAWNDIRVSKWWRLQKAVCMDHFYCSLQGSCRDKSNCPWYFDRYYTNYNQFAKYSSSSQKDDFFVSNLPVLLMLTKTNKCRGAKNMPGIWAQML